MYELIYSERFQRASAKFLRKHPDLASRYERILRDLRSDPFQPHLRLHALHGIHQGKQAVSLTYEYRITLVVQVTEKEIILHDIGGHDVYR